MRRKGFNQRNILWGHMPVGNGSCYNACKVAIELLVRIHEQDRNNWYIRQKDQHNHQLTRNKHVYPKTKSVKQRAKI